MIDQRLSRPGFAIVLAAVFAPGCSEEPADEMSGNAGTIAMNGASMPPGSAGTGTAGMPPPNTGAPVAMPTMGMAAGAGLGAAGTPGSGAGAGAGATQPGDVACTITPRVTMSPAISTVASVEFTTDLAGLSAARIEFGLDASYGMTAPVDLAEPGYRTLLLGMKTSREYHFRIVANGKFLFFSSSKLILETIGK
jgi:hypothetical protein